MPDRNTERRSSRPESDHRRLSQKESSSTREAERRRSKDDSHTQGSATHSHHRDREPVVVLRGGRGHHNVRDPPREDRLRERERSSSRHGVQKSSYHSSQVDRTESPLSERNGKDRTDPGWQKYRSSRLEPSSREADLGGRDRAKRDVRKRDEPTSLCAPPLLLSSCVAARRGYQCRLPCRPTQQQAEPGGRNLQLSCPGTTAIEAGQSEYAALAGLPTPAEHVVLPPPPAAPKPRVAPELDFFSLQFDAACALATPGLHPPNPRVRALGMLGQCRFILPPEMEESLANADFARKNEDKAEAEKARTAAVARRVMAEELKQSAVQRIAQGVVKGPLLLLRECYDEGGRVRVVTRHARGIRGVATGFLKAFDKQMNLVLQDVEETYTVRLKVERSKPVLCRREDLEGMPIDAEELRPAAEAGVEGGEAADYVLVDKTRTAFRQDQRRRKLKQIFVRGSNIVMVSRDLWRQDLKPS